MSEIIQTIGQHLHTKGYKITVRSDTSIIVWKHLDAGYSIPEPIVVRMHGARLAILEIRSNDPSEIVIDLNSPQAIQQLTTVLQKLCGT